MVVGGSRGPGGGRGWVRRRLMARAGLTLPDDLVAGSVDVGGLTRTYHLAPTGGAEVGALLVALHGAGGAGPGMAALTGLSTRGPAAGFAVVFPDGVGRVWNDNREAPRLARRERVDDVGFLAALIERLLREHRLAPTAVYLAGISNGAFLSEHLARHALVPAAGIALVAGTATVPSRQRQPVPARAAHVLMFEGTADPLVPYDGGPIGPAGRMAQRRGPGRGEPGRGVAAGAEAVAGDWAKANGAPLAPDKSVTPARGAADLAVTRLRWAPPGGSGPEVVLHRVEGGGHTWPGGAQYLPERFVGPVARSLDATGLILTAFAPRR